MRVWVTLPVVLALALIGGQAGAQSLNVFTISGVAVDEVAESAEVARKKAFANGERKAFERLFKRLTVRADHVRAGDAAVKDISALVQDIQVADQKNSQIRYLAKLTFRFKPAAVREFLRDMAVGFAETRSKPVLVLPVYESAGAVSLWDDSNIWRDAFAATVPADDRTGVVSGERPVAGITGVEDSGARPDSATAPTAQSVTEAGPASEPSSSTEADLLAAGLRPTATQQSRRNMLLTAVVSAVIAIVAVVVLDQLRDDDSPQVTSATASAQSPIIVSATVNEVIATSAPPGSPPSTSVPPFREPSTTGPPAVAKDAATGAATSKLAPVEIDRSDPYGQ